MGDQLRKFCTIVGRGLFAALLLIDLAVPQYAAAQNATIDRDIALLQKILQQRPDAELYYRLGDLYIQKGRQTGDITYFTLAGNSLREALKLEPDLAAVHRHLAFVMYSLHDFAGATKEALQAIKLHPEDSYAYGVLGDAQLETGQYTEAARTYAQMVVLKGDIYSFGRRSGLETIRGQDALAIADLKRAIANGIAAGEPSEAIAWSQTTLAQDYFLMGQLDNARQQAGAALQTYPQYHRALAVLAQALAAQGKLKEAAEDYRNAIAVIPLPEYAAALGDVYAQMGRDQDAQQQRQLVEFIAHLNSLNKILYNRVLVDYYADHDLKQKEAVTLALEEFKLRQDIYGHDALAWSLYRDNQAAAAIPHMEAALRFNTVDARLYFHAGLIYAAVGRKDEARASLKRALAINSHFQPILDRVAIREYQTLGGKPEYAESGTGLPR